MGRCIAPSWLEEGKSTAMSNLGGYQVVTTGIKAMGGPIPALAKVVGGIVLGSVIIFRSGVNFGAKRRDGKTSEAKVVGWMRARFARSGADKCSKVYTTHADVECGCGLTLHVGDTFRAGNVIGDMVYIEVDGSNDNPFIVSVEQLAQHSDYPLHVEEGNDLLDRD